MYKIVPNLGLHGLLKSVGTKQNKKVCMCVGKESIEKKVGMEVERTEVSKSEY